MSAHTEKTLEKRSHPAPREHAMEQEGGAASFPIFEMRSDALAQRMVQEAADNSPEVKQLMAYQEAANQSPQVQESAQLQAKADEHTSQQSVQKKEAQVAPSENKTGLPDNLKSGMEDLSGISLDDVKVHYNSDQPAQLKAHAFAQGTDIHLAAGQEQHLAHEAWHVVQQKQGRVEATRQMKGVAINDNTELEKEADVMGAKANAMGAKGNPAKQLKKDVQGADNDINNSVGSGAEVKQAKTVQKKSDSNANSPLNITQHKSITPVVQGKFDHLFNDIPKTLSNLPDSLKSSGIQAIRLALNALRDDHANGGDGVHQGVDQNSTDFGHAQLSFLIAAEAYSKSKIDERAMREATFTLWKFSFDAVVGRNVANGAAKIDRWNSFERETWEALTSHKSSFK